MEIEFDSRKNAINRAKHGLDLGLATGFEWESAVIKPDERKEYGEIRYSAQGLVDGRLHTLVFTRRQDKLRIISLRKSNVREVNDYEKTKT